MFYLKIFEYINISLNTYDFEQNKVTLITEIFRIRGIDRIKINKILYYFSTGELGENK